MSASILGYFWKKLSYQNFQIHRMLFNTHTHTHQWCRIYGNTNIFFLQTFVWKYKFHQTKVTQFVEFEKLLNCHFFAWQLTWCANLPLSVCWFRNLIGRKCEHIFQWRMKTFRNKKCLTKRVCTRGAAIAQWICLCFPSCSPWVWVPSTPSTLLSICIWFVSCRKDENKIDKKRPG